MIKETIPYGRQLIEEDDIAAVAAVLRSDFLTQGPAVEAFEEALSAYAGATYAVCFSSGTAALHAAYHAAGITRGDEVITTPITFAATANAALYVGARPVFADVEPDTGNIDATLVEGAVTSLTKAVVPVHYAGHPVDMEKLSSVARKRGLIVIEDACHAIGAQYKAGPRYEVRGTRENPSKTSLLSPRTSVLEPQSSSQSEDWFPVGACAHSDMTVFSFHPVKQITTGEGGAVLTNNPKYYERLLQFRTHGIAKDHFSREPDGDWYYEMQSLGFNYRMTDLQAALGTSQLAKLNRFVQRRRAIAARYDNAFAENPWFDIPVERGYARSSVHLYPIRLKQGPRERRKEIFRAMKDAGLGVQVHYIPVYLQPYYQGLGYASGLCPMAEDFYSREISIPLYPGLTDQGVELVIDRLREVLRAV